MDLDVGTGVESSARASRSAFDARIDRDARDRRRSARGAVGHHASTRPTDRPTDVSNRPTLGPRARPQTTNHDHASPYSTSCETPHSAHYDRRRRRRRVSCARIRLTRRDSHRAAFRDDGSRFAVEVRTGRARCARRARRRRRATTRRRRDDDAGDGDAAMTMGIASCEPLAQCGG